MTDSVHAVFLSYASQDAMALSRPGPSPGVARFVDCSMERFEP